MSSEWLKVMLEEIARKKDEEAQARLEHELRHQDARGRTAEPSPDSSPPEQTPPERSPPSGPRPSR